MDLVALLKDNGAEMTGLAFDDEFPLHRAATSGHTELETVRKLLDNGADPNLVAGNKWTPLHAAMFSLYMLDHEVPELLIQHGADVNAKGAHGWTPLHIACLLGRGRSISELISHGADPRILDDEGRLPKDMTSVTGQRIGRRARQALAEIKPNDKSPQ